MDDAPNYLTDDFTDDEILSRARRYAAKVFDESVRGKPIERHHVNGAVKITGYLLQLHTATDKEAAPLLGMIISEMKKANA